MSHLKVKFNQLAVAEVQSSNSRKIDTAKTEASSSKADIKKNNRKLRQKFKLNLDLANFPSAKVNTNTIREEAYAPITSEECSNNEESRIESSAECTDFTSEYDLYTNYESGKG